MNSVTFNFNETQFTIIDRNGQAWLKASQIGDALAYTDDKSINHLYSRNADEFTENMTTVVKLTTVTGEKDTRIFSLRGAHLLGMLANTEPAKDFRRWILDVLENANQSPALTTTLQHHLLAANPKLALAMLYHQSRLSINDIAKLLNLSVRKVEQLMDKLTDCGLIPSTSPETQLELI